MIECLGISAFCRSLHYPVVSRRLVLREDAAHADGLHGERPRKEHLMSRSVPQNSDRECRKELQNSNGRNRALRVGADLPSEFL